MGQQLDDNVQDIEQSGTFTEQALEQCHQVKTTKGGGKVIEMQQRPVLPGNIPAICRWSHK